MQVSVEELSPTRRKVSVEIEAAVVTEEVDRAFHRLQHQVRLKGFRPGKAPRGVLEKFYGAQVRADAVAHVIEHTYGKALEETGLRPIGQPEIVPEEVDGDRPLKYAATIDVQPETVIETWQGLPAKRHRVPITDARVDEAIERLRESLAELRPIEGREEAARGDIARVDVSVSIGERVLEDRAMENRTVEVGSDTSPREVGEAIAGMKIGQSRAVDVSFPDDHGDPELAGQSVRFELTLRDLREKILPEIDDDLARDHGECESLDELRTNLRKRLEESVERDVESSLRGQLIDELLRANEMTVAETLVEQQVEGLVENFLSGLGPNAERLRADAEAMRKVREDARSRAEQQVKAALALAALGKSLEIEVPDGEVDAKIEEIASGAGTAADQIRAAYRDAEARAELRARLVRDAALERIVEAAVIEEVEIDPNVIADPEQTR